MVSGGIVSDKIEAVPELKGQKLFDAKAMIKSGRRFSIPSRAFQRIPTELCFIRKRGGRSSLDEATSVSLIPNVSYSVFSDQRFVLRAPNLRLSAPQRDADELRALSVLFSSSLVRYFLFFHSPAWGIGRSNIYKGDIEKIPIPHLATEQISALAALQKELAKKEENPTLSTRDLNDILDDEIEKILNIPKNLSILARDFIRVRLSINEGKVARVASQTPQESGLLEYGQLLRNELDQFAKGRVHHHVSFLYVPGQEMVICEVTVKSVSRPLAISMGSTNGHLNTSLSELKRKLRQQFSQWIYVQRGLRIFDGSSVYICKAPRLIDWTKTQALNDADDLIAEVLSNRNSGQEVAVHGTG